MKIVIGFMAAMLLLSACKKSNSSKPAVNPTAADLLFPAADASCVTGTVLSVTVSEVDFKWNAGDNTDTYQLVIANMLTSRDTTITVSQPQLLVGLPMNTAYAWHVVSHSKASSNTAKSSTWKFYNAGPGYSTNAPFPAQLTAPAYGQILATVSSVNLSWQSNANNTDNLTYDVYFGNSATPGLFKSNVSDSSVGQVPVQSGKTYYWQVVTKDSNGNSADSGISSFLVQ